MSRSHNSPTPNQIIEQLDKYIIGQKEAKKQLAIADRNRWRRMRTPSDIRKEIVPTNILIIGPTGTGKTECVRRLAKITDAPFVKVEATRFTERGYVGDKVDSMIRRLADNAFEIVKQEKQKEVQKKAEASVEQMILDILIPPLTPSQTLNPISTQQAGTPEVALNQETRERFLRKIRSHELDDRKIEINMKEKNDTITGGFIGGSSIDESAMIGLQNMLGKILPKNLKSKKVTIAQAKKILLEQEIDRLIDPNTIKEEALNKAQYEGIVFIDEIDKITNTGRKAGGADVSREGVQRDLLPIVEGSTVDTKYGTLSTDHILFIAAGAFHLSQPSDLIPELQGRLPIRVKLNPLTTDDFVRILQEPSNSLIKQYQALFQAEGVLLNFTQTAIAAIASFAFMINNTMQNIGARRLRTVLSHLLKEFLGDVPDTIRAGESINITETIVQERLAPLAKQDAIDQYIL